MIDARLQFLLDGYFDGAISQEERAELERILLSSPEGRRAYWDTARLHANLTKWGQEEWGRQLADQPPIEIKSVLRHKATQRWIPWLTGLAACALLAILFLLNRPSGTVVQNNPAPTTNNSLPTGVAILASSLNAVWDSQLPLPVQAKPIEAGTLLKLISGMAQVETFSGARLILQGPVEVTLKSDMDVFCHHGKVTAYVPAPARGFVVRNDVIRVIDLGTEFGLDSGVDGKSEVQVFNGRVDVRMPSNAKETVVLQAGDTGRMSDGSFAKIQAGSATFVRSGEYEALAAQDSQTRFAQWEKMANALRNDAAMLAFYTFADGDVHERTISNTAKQGTGPATLVGCGRVDGRWPTRRAVEFKAPGDRLRLEIDGEFKALTCFAWVRVDALNNAYQALLSPDGVAAGTTRWGLTEKGELRLGVARDSGKPEPLWDVAVSKPMITSDKLGTWVMLATTVEERVIRHYLNGQLVSSSPISPFEVLQIGAAEVGNWRGSTPRNFSGRMDELGVLSRALSDGELQALYESGKRFNP